jgi:peptide/nickel transport system permease protein
MTVPVMLGVVTLVFLLLHLIPGDPVDLMLGESAQPAQRTELKARLHLDEPLPAQYARYLAGVARFDLGTSIRTGEPVADRILGRFPYTLKLASAALLFALLLALPLGVLAAARRRTLWDSTSTFLSLLGLSVPAFWLGPVLILLFAFYLGWFPISGSEEALSIVLPAVTLGSGMAALLTRMTRSTVLEVLKEDYIRTARAKGLSRFQVYGKHALRNALLPIVTVLSLQAGALLAGSIITEKIFSWPGIGLELLDGIERRDYPVVQGCVLLIALSYVLINLAADLSYAWIDPRIRYGRERR